MLFTKPEYKEIELPFIYDNNPEDIEAGMISIEAYGNILGENKYCYASYFVDLDYIDEIAAVLNNGFQKYEQNGTNKTVRVILKLKKGKLKDFKIDLNSLAKAYGDKRLKTLELAAWGLNEKSFKELN